LGAPFRRGEPDGRVDGHRMAGGFMVLGCIVYRVLIINFKGRWLFFGKPRLRCSLTLSLHSCDSSEPDLCDSGCNG
ncbi:hypothetical protein ACJX0J_041132, partial [Zea mays]